MIRRAIVFDPHPMTLGAVAEVVRQGGFEVVVETTSVEEAFAAAEREHPDLLLVSKESDEGPEVDAGLRAAHVAVPDLRSVVLSHFDDPATIRASFEAGASAYVVRTARADDLAAALRQAFVQSVYFAPAHGDDRTAMDRVLDRDPTARLTRREVEILTLVADGRSNADLARQLWVTEQTVKFHLSNIYRKLNVANRTEASRWAHTNGLLAAPAAAVDESSVPA